MKAHLLELPLQVDSLLVFGPVQMYISKSILLNKFLQ
jgi:hypothetical protein